MLNSSNHLATDWAVPVSWETFKPFSSKPENEKYKNNNQDYLILIFKTFESSA